MGPGPGPSPRCLLGTPVGSYMDAALLPNGDAYVVWTVNGPGTLGASLHFDLGSTQTQWSAIDTVSTTANIHARVVADGDGDLTVIAATGAGSLEARRRIGGSWGAATTLGATNSAWLTAVIDPSGAVTVARNAGNGSIFHHRIAKGATAWAGAVRVDQAIGTGVADPTHLTLALDPTNGDPILVWRTQGDIVYSICR